MVSLTEALVIVGGFLFGSIPFSVIIGRLALKKDIREYGDGNPGTFNVIRAGGLMWGGLAMFADIFKGALPVGLAAYILRYDGWVLIACAMAPVLGHAFSPFLRGRGGKAIATSFGMWIGLSIFPFPMAAVILLVYWYTAVTVSGWAVILTMLSLLLYLVLTSAPTLWLIVWGLNMALFIYRHRNDLRQPLRLKVSPLFKPFFPRLASQINPRPTDEPA